MFACPFSQKTKGLLSITFMPDYAGIPLSLIALIFRRETLTAGPRSLDQTSNHMFGSLKPISYLKNNNDPPLPSGWAEEAFVDP